MFFSNFDVLSSDKKVTQKYSQRTTLIEVAGSIFTIFLVKLGHNLWAKGGYEPKVDFQEGGGLFTFHIYQHIKFKMYFQKE